MGCESGDRIRTRSPSTLCTLERVIERSSRPDTLKIEQRAHQHYVQRPMRLSS